MRCRLTAVISYQIMALDLCIGQFEWWVWVDMGSECWFSLCFPLLTSNGFSLGVCLCMGQFEWQVWVCMGSECCLSMYFPLLNFASVEYHLPKYYPKPTAPLTEPQIYREQLSSDLNISIYKTIRLLQYVSIILNLPILMFCFLKSDFLQV